MKERIHTLLNKITLAKFGIAFSNYDEMEKLEVAGNLLDYIQKELQEIEDELTDPITD